MRLFSVKSLSIICAGVIVFLALIPSCGPTNPTKSNTLDDFVITNQISGWTLRGDSLTRFVDSTLHYTIDGGDISYCGSNCAGGNSNLKAGIVYNMDNAAKDASVQIFVMDYGTAGNAKMQFDTITFIKIAPTSKVSIAPFSDADAVGSAFAYGMDAYCHSKRYYFELKALQGAAYDSTYKSVADASTFLTYFQSKVK